MNVCMKVFVNKYKFKENQVRNQVRKNESYLKNKSIL